MIERLRKRTLAGTRWIAEGNYKSVRDLVWARATALVWLNYPYFFVVRRALVRGVRRRRQMRDALAAAEFAHLEVFEIRDPAEAEALIAVRW
jgi:hypothetical protein